MLFITWQRIAIFKKGYSITDLKKQVMEEEIKNVALKEEFLSIGSLEKIDIKARNLWKMDVPTVSQRMTLKVSAEKVLPGVSKARSFIVHLKKVLLPDAEAK